MCAKGIINREEAEHKQEKHPCREQQKGENVLFNKYFSYKSTKNQTNHKTLQKSGPQTDLQVGNKHVQSAHNLVSVCFTGRGPKLGRSEDVLGTDAGGKTLPECHVANTSEPKYPFPWTPQFHS